MLYIPVLPGLLSQCKHDVYSIRNSTSTPGWSELRHPQNLACLEECHKGVVIARSNAVVKLKLPIVVRRTPGNGDVCQSSEAPDHPSPFARAMIVAEFSRFSLTSISRPLDGASKSTKVKAAELGKRPETLPESLSGSHCRSLPCSHTYRCASSPGGQIDAFVTPRHRLVHFTCLQFGRC